MSNIKNAFKNKKAFIAFFTCGDPDLETTAEVVRAAVENGADLVASVLDAPDHNKQIRRQMYEQTSSCNSGKA